MSDAVQTEYGPVAGEAKGGTRIFRGIPFAQAPQGELRWKPPVPPKPWKDVRDATQWGHDCPQVYAREMRAPGQSEDCLSLNVWTPAKDAGANLPVLVWLYGGSFVGGSGSDPRSDGELFAKHGAILVTFNYRSGLMGFLGHPDLTKESPNKSSSNYGVLDMVAALKWVKANIKNFGGNPNSITVFGCSAGSAGIGLLLVSPLCKGLFDRAILECPGSFRPLASLADSEKAGLMLGDDIKNIRAMSWQDVLKRQPDFIPKMRGLTTPRVLRPIRDGWVIPEDEADAVKAGRFNKMPILVGNNADEGTPFIGSWPIKTVDDFKKVIEENFSANNMVKEALEAYPVKSEADIKHQLAMMFGDCQFQYGGRRWAREMAKAGQPAYRYVFTRERADLKRPPFHAEEVEYVFGEPQLGETGPSGNTYDATDAKVSETMMDAWIRFAATGNPNGPGLPTWPKYDPREDSYMDFADSPSVKYGFRKPALDFLDRYFGAV
jgi:carboxylesterase type B